MKLLSTLATQMSSFSRGLRVARGPIRTLASNSGVAIPREKKFDPRHIDSAVDTVAGEVRFDELEPHELKRMREDREKQLDIRNFTLNFGPQHPVGESKHASGDVRREWSVEIRI